MLNVSERLIVSIRVFCLRSHDATPWRACWIEVMLSCKPRAERQASRETLAQKSHNGTSSATFCRAVLIMRSTSRVKSHKSRTHGTIRSDGLVLKTTFRRALSKRLTVSTRREPGMPLWFDEVRVRCQHPKQRGRSKIIDEESLCTGLAQSLCSTTHDLSRFT